MARWTSQWVRCAVAFMKWGERKGREMGCTGVEFFLIALVGFSIFMKQLNSFWMFPWMFSKSFHFQAPLPWHPWYQPMLWKGWSPRAAGISPHRATPACWAYPTLSYRESGWQRPFPSWEVWFRWAAPRPRGPEQRERAVLHVGFNCGFFSRWIKSGCVMVMEIYSGSVNTG